MTAVRTDLREVIRYLGYRNETPDPEVLRECRECLAVLEQAVTPRCVYEFYDLAGGAGDETEYGGVLRIPGAGIEIRSRMLQKNLRGCTGVCLFAATLGPAPDRLIARESVRSMSRAVILQAAAAAMIEAYCDEVNRRIAWEAAETGLYCRPRFSPGYGDVPLSMQREIANALQMGKKAGITLTETMLMVPSKSVTALIGLSPEEKACDMRGCEICSMRESCLYSRVPQTAKPDAANECKKDNSSTQE